MCTIFTLWRKGKNMAGSKGFKQLKFSDRLHIEKYLNVGLSKKEISNRLGVHISTIYNELKRGQYEHLNSDYTISIKYSPEIAQKRCDENLKVRGTTLKIKNDFEYANYIENKIIEENYSPAAVLGELKATKMECKFKTKICVTTLYSYIEKGVFLNITNKNLPVKRNRKRKYNVVRVQARANAGTSIEKRETKIEKRNEFGHWEMDSVIGMKKSKNTLLVLTERKTREEIIFKLPNHTAGEVVNALDTLELKWGGLFNKVFKTITVDNGCEFAYCERMEKSIVSNGNRTKLYYCHPYSSWERGSNEVTNKMIRRKIPKGTNFDGKSFEEIKEIENWINTYPRRILGYKTSEELFRREIKKLLKKKDKAG